MTMTMVNIWVNIMNMVKIRCLKIPAKFLLNTQISCQELSYAAQVCTFDAFFLTAENQALKVGPI